MTFKARNFVWILCLKRISYLKRLVELLSNISASWRCSVLGKSQSTHSREYGCVGQLTWTKITVSLYCSKSRWSPSPSFWTNPHWLTLYLMEYSRAMKFKTISAHKNPLELHKIFTQNVFDPHALNLNNSKQKLLILPLLRVGITEQELSQISRSYKHKI